MTMLLAGQTANFVVSYDDSITLANGYQATGLALAQAVLASCESDLETFSSLFGGLMPAPASIPFQVNLVPGAGLDPLPGQPRSRRWWSQPSGLFVDGHLLLHLPDE